MCSNVYVYVCVSSMFDFVSVFSTLNLQPHALSTQTGRVPRLCLFLSFLSPLLDVSGRVHVRVNRILFI